MLIRRTTTNAAIATLTTPLLDPATVTSAAPADVFRGDLVDLSAATADPFGGASAHLTGGTGASDTTVSFLPAPGDRAVVIHAEPTAANGTAGARLVCRPVVW